MAIFWKLFSLTKSPALAFFSVGIVGLFLASSIQQSLGLECYDCMFDADLDDADVNPPYYKECATLGASIPIVTCNDTSPYCVKKYVEVTYGGGLGVQKYMSRECSGNDELPDLTGQTLPVCFEVTGSVTVNTTVGPAKLKAGFIKQTNKKKLPDPGTVDYTTVSNICVCNQEKCNSGPGEKINATDGGPFTTTVPTDKPVEGTGDPDIKEIGDGVGLVRPSLYFLVPAVPFFLASHVLRSMSAGANI